MKVSSSSQQALQNVYQGHVDRSRSADQHSAGRRAGLSDSVELSERVQLMQKAVRVAADSEVTPREHLTRLREQVQNDSYQVPVEQLAARLMTNLF